MNHNFKNGDLVFVMSENVVNQAVVIEFDEKYNSYLLSLPKAYVEAAVFVPKDKVFETMDDLVDYLKKTATEYKRKPILKKEDVC